MYKIKNIKVRYKTKPIIFTILFCFFPNITFKINIGIPVKMEIIKAHKIVCNYVKIVVKTEVTAILTLIFKKYKANLAHLYNSSFSI